MHYRKSLHTLVQLPCQCHRCGKMSHFGAACLTRLLNTMGENDAAYDQCESTQDSSTLDSFFLDTVEDSQNSKYWTTTINVNEFEISFKLDTGAEVSDITKNH